MRIVAWNINHRIREKAIPRRMTEAIISLDPDVIVLTEYVHGSGRQEFLATLAQHGFPYWLVSECRPRENHVLIAARTELEPGSIRAPEIAPSVPSNALHARLPCEDLDLLGIRIPVYSRDPKTKRAVWNWMIETARSMEDRPSVLIGDFNTDPGYSKRMCGDCIGRLIEDGWQPASPPQGASYWSPNGKGVRIDHAFVSKHFLIESATYVVEYAGHLFAGKDPRAFSDHAALSIDIRRVSPWKPDHPSIQRKSRNNERSRSSSGLSMTSLP